MIEVKVAMTTGVQADMTTEEMIEVLEIGDLVVTVIEEKVDLTIVVAVVGLTTAEAVVDSMIVVAEVGLMTVVAVVDLMTVVVEGDSKTAGDSGDEMTVDLVEMTGGMIDTAVVAVDALKIEMVGGVFAKLLVSYIYSGNNDSCVLSNWNL
jgi:hypothetical protein